MVWADVIHHVMETIVLSEKFSVLSYFRFLIENVSQNSDQFFSYCKLQKFYFMFVCVKVLHTVSALLLLSLLF